VDGTLFKKKHVLMQLTSKVCNSLHWYTTNALLSWVKAGDLCIGIQNQTRDLDIKLKCSYQNVVAEIGVVICGQNCCVAFV